MFEFPVLIGDIGGTNARFALVEQKGAKPRLLSHEATADHADPRTRSAPPSRRPGRRAAAAFRHPRHRRPGRWPGDPADNAHWKVNGERIAGDFGLSSAVIVNDYVPVAAGAAGIEPQDLTPVGRCPEVKGGARVVLGPGTGFGAAALIPYSDQLAIVSTEAGHTELGPTDAFEEKVWHALERVEDRITVETVLSGPASPVSTPRWPMPIPDGRTTRSSPPR